MRTAGNPFTQHDKENRQVNARPCILEDDFTKISQEYVLDGGRLRPKSIKYRDERHEKERSQAMKEVEEPHPIEVEKLLCLEQHGVLNTDEQQRLAELRQMGLAGAPLEKEEDPYNRGGYGGEGRGYQQWGYQEFRHHSSAPGYY